MGLLLLFLSLAVGYCMVKLFLDTDRPVMILSGTIILGMVISGTLLYLLDLLFIKLTGSYFAAMIVFSVAALVFVVSVFYRLGLGVKLKKELTSLLQDGPAVLVLIFGALFSAWLCYSTFMPFNGDIRVAGAWSDINYHHAFVRSVAEGRNVPVQYPYFANSPMHWHFMFNYYTGKLAQAGMNSVDALNLTSILGFLTLLILIFEFGRGYFKSMAAGVLGVVFLLFHSSMSVFAWSSQVGWANLLPEILSKKGWLSLARFEDWGLFNLNVFTNQRHFALTIAFLVYLVCYITELRNRQENGLLIKENLLRKYRSFIFFGMVMGMLPFWNMAVAIAGITISGLFALTFIKRLQVFKGLVLLSVTAGLITLPQLLLVKSGDTVLSEFPKFHPGFALEAFSAAGFLEYYMQTLGFKLVMLLIAVIIVKKLQRADLLILALPFFMANTIQFGKILYDNNKFIILSLVFINVYAAYGVIWLYRNTRVFLRFIPVILTAAMVFAGVVDFFAVKNQTTVVIADRSSLLRDWISRNTEPEAVFATNTFIPFGDNAMMAVTLAGRKLYAVTNDVDSSCNVQPRLENIRRLYSFEGGPNQTGELVEKEKIDYIIVDSLVRENKSFMLDEQSISGYFDPVYSSQCIEVYRTK